MFIGTFRLKITSGIHMFAIYILFWDSLYILSIFGTLIKAQCLQLTKPHSNKLMPVIVFVQRQMITVP